MSEHLRVYIGYDMREDTAYKVCASTIERHSSVPLQIQPISVRHPAYSRPFEVRGGQPYDQRDRRPFSTEFSFARFLVPLDCKFEGWALFCDCDFVWRRDVAELLRYRDEKPDKAAFVVKHAYTPRFEEKMDGMRQTTYPRKNWSSMVLWNCGHEKNKTLTADCVNRMPGTFLHGFAWLDIQRDIAELPLEWNWLEGEYPPVENPAAIHFTNGGPWLGQWTGVRYASLWYAEKAWMLNKAKGPAS